MNPSPDLVHSLLHHTRRSDQAIGVDFDSQLVSALYGCLEDMAKEEATTIQGELALAVKMLEVLNG